MSLTLIDSHCHLDDDRFDDDRDQVISRALSRGVRHIVIPATVADRWPKILHLCQTGKGLHPAYGLHPMFMSEHLPRHLEQLDQWLSQHQAVAVGECGLDFYHGQTDMQLQLELFKGQLDIALNHRLPVIIHSRKSLDLVLKELRTRPLVGGVVHSFSGSLQQAQQLEQQGFKLGIAATVSYPRARKLREIVANMDKRSLLIESDAPDQPGPEFKGQRNEPAHIPHHLQIMSELKKMPIDVLAQQLVDNSHDVFKINS